MGGKGDSSTSTQAIQQQQVDNASALTALAKQSSANSQQLFNTTFPGLQTGEDFYASLASGDPGKIAAAIAPAAQQINQATASARNNIMNSTPEGGERNLALDQADLNQGAQVGSAAANSFVSAPNALSQLAGQGVNQSIGAAGTGISGYGSSNQGLGSAGQLGIQQKGANLGALGSLAGTGATLATAF